MKKEVPRSLFAFAQLFATLFSNPTWFSLAQNRASKPGSEPGYPEPLRLVLPMPRERLGLRMFQEENIGKIGNCFSKSLNAMVH